MLPDTQDRNAIPAEQARDPAVAQPVSTKLVFPILALINRGNVAPGATMPEATIDKECDPLPREPEIWPAFYA